MKKQKGITLIALIITIIVLLILAGVTVITLTGDNGVLTKAKDALEQTNRATAEEEVKLAYTELTSEYYEDLAKNANVDIYDYLKDTDFSRALEATGTISNYKKTAGGTITFKYIPNGKNQEYNITILPSGQVTATIVNEEEAARIELNALREYFIGKNFWDMWGNGANGWGPIFEPDEILSDSDTIIYTNINNDQVFGDKTKEIAIIEYHSTYYRLTLDRSSGEVIGVGYLGKNTPERDNIIGKNSNELYNSGWEQMNSEMGTSGSIYSYQNKKYEVWFDRNWKVAHVVEAKDFNIANKVIKFDSIENTPGNKNISINLTGMSGNVEWNVDNDNVARIISNTGNTAEIQPVSDGFTKLRVKSSDYEFEVYCIICVGNYDVIYETGLPYGFEIGMTWGEMLEAGYNTDIFGAASSDGGLGCPVKKGEIIWDGWPLDDPFAENYRVFVDTLMVPERNYETYCY